MNTSLNKYKDINVAYSVSRINKRIIYDPKFFGFKNVEGDGSSVKICIIDTGYADHKDLPPVNLQKICDFSNKNFKPIDKHGHSTAIAGILAANNKKQIIGIAPKSILYFAKALNEDGNGKYDSVISSIIWAIVQKVDIIIMSIGGNYDSQMLHDVIKKAYSQNICIFAAQGVSNDIKSSENMFPSKYDEVLCAGFSNKIDKIISVNDKHIMLPKQNIQTLSVDDRYVKVSGSSFCAPIIAGIAARIIQKKNKEEKYVAPAGVYKEIRSLSR